MPIATVTAEQQLPASHAVSERAGDQGEDAEEDDADDQHGEELRALEAETGSEPGGVERLPGRLRGGARGLLVGRSGADHHEEGRHQIEEHIGGDHGDRGEDQRLPRRAEHAGDRDCGHALLVDHLLEGRALHQLQAHPQAHDHQDRGEQERQTPPPRHELRVGQLHAEDHEQQVREDETDGRAELRERAVEGSLAGRGVLGGEQGRTGPFAAQTDALAEAQQHQDRGRQHREAGGRGGGQHADEEGRDAHHQQARDQGGLTAHPVTEVAEDERAQRAGDEGDAEDRERAQQLVRRRLRREEQCREDQGGRCRIGVEVEELDRRADHRGGDDATAGVRGGCGRGRRGGGWCCTHVGRP